jgi:tetratricopeptide (TPR) repeat protein
VRKSGQMLRVTAQLVDVAGGYQLWSSRYDRKLEDVFAIQDEISRAIVNQLRLTIGRGQRRYQTNFPTYELYLRARALVTRRFTANGVEAARLFEQVIAKDSSYAPAYAGLADAYAEMSWQIAGLSSEEGLMRMRPAAVKALELDPLLAEAHAAMGMTFARECDWENARKSFDRALELNPSLTQARTRYSTLTLLPLGKVAEALELLRVALTTDPLSIDARRALAFVQIVAGRYDEAIANARQVRAVDPDFPGMDLILSRALTFSGRPEEAIALRAKYGPTGEIWLARAYVMSGRRDEAERLARDQTHPYRQAIVYAALGDKDRTLDALHRAVDIMAQRTALLLSLPEMALLRGDPRLDAIRARLKLK